MYWATHSRPIPLEELGWINTTYLVGGPTRCDPMMVWGTSVDAERLDEFLAAQRRSTGLILSPAHVLVRAVAESLRRHPEVNRRVTGRRIHQYDGVNIMMPMMQTRTGEVETVFLHRADEMSLADIARHFWDEARHKALRAADDERRRRERASLKNLGLRLARHLRLRWVHAMSGVAFYVGNRVRVPTIWPWQQELNGAGAFVNYLGFPGAPPMISYKPSCLPMNALTINVTLGPTEPRAVVEGNAVVIRKQAPLFVRTDHRVINGHQAAAFVATLRTHLSDPWTLVQPAGGVDTRRAA